jgi:vacuolar-type H+-ATPase subunit I/STV1
MEKKLSLNESLDRQRKLMGLNETMSYEFKEGGYAEYSKPMEESEHDEEEGELDEIFGINTAIKGAIGGAMQGAKKAIMLRKIDNQITALQKTIQQMTQFVNKSDGQFNQLQSMQQQVAQLGANDPIVKRMTTIFGNMGNTWKAQKESLAQMSQFVTSLSQASSTEAAQADKEAATQSNAVQGNNQGNVQGGGNQNNVTTNFKIGDNVMYKGKKYKIGDETSPGNYKLINGPSIPVTSKNLQPA